jgi:hypothetical protein
MVFDLDNRDSFLNLSHWEDEMKRYGVEMNRIKVTVCGNKTDAKGRVRKKQLNCPRKLIQMRFRNGLRIGVMIIMKPQQVQEIM